MTMTITTASKKIQMTSLHPLNQYRIQPTPQRASGPHAFKRMQTAAVPRAVEQVIAEGTI